MLITKLFKHKHLFMWKKIAVKVGCSAVFGQPHVVLLQFLSGCGWDAFNDFVRNLIKGLGYRH